MICVWAAPPTCVSRGLRAYQGVYAHTQGLTCERTMWLSGRYHPGQAPDNVVEQPIPPGTAQNADHFAISSPFSAFFTEVVCVLGATLPRTAAAPPPIWGNCAMQGCDTPATRRQKALHGAKPPPPPVASALQGAGGPGCSARGRRRGLAGPTPTGTHSDPAPLVWRAPEGPEGQAAAPVGGGRAWPGRHPPVHTATRPHWCGGRRRDRRARAGFEARRRTK